MSEVTNPAAELHGLCLALKSLPGDRETTRAVLARFFDTQPDSAEHHAMVSAVADRFENFDRLVSRLDVPDDLKRGAHDASSHLRRVISSVVQNNTWSDVKKQTFTEGPMATLRFLGPTIQHIAQIRILDQEDRQKIIDKLDNAVSELETADDAVSGIVLITLKTLRRAVTKLHIYGTDAVIDKVRQAVFTIDAASRHPRAQGGKSKLRKAMDAVAYAYAALMIPVDASGALKFYDEPVRMISHYIVESWSSEPILLPPPQKYDRHDEDSAIRPEEPRSERKRGTAKGKPA